MQPTSLEQCYRLLELPQTATAEEIRAAFRRLARQHHPDTHPRQQDNRRFIEVAHAYRVLREKLRVRPPDSEWGPCPSCGQWSDILVGLDSRKRCADCLLGVTQRNRILPMPFVAFARHLATLALYGACVFCLFVYLESGKTQHAAISLVCGLLGMIVLAAEVMWIIRDDSKIRQMRLNDPRHARRRRAAGDSTSSSSSVVSPISLSVAMVVLLIAIVTVAGMAVHRLLWPQWPG